MAISRQTRKLLNERLQLVDRLAHKFNKEFGDDGSVPCTKCGFDRNHKIHAERWMVECWESERGWGRSSMGKSYFDTKAKADAYVLDYNKDNTADTAPDCYFIADSPRQI